MGSCLRHGKRCSATRVSDCLTGIDLCAPRARLRVSDSIWNSVEVSSPRWTVPKDPICAVPAVPVRVRVK